MRNLQITIFIFIGLLVISSCATQIKANQDTDEWRYESQCAGREGVKGVYSLWVSSYSNNANNAIAIYDS